LAAKGGSARARQRARELLLKALYQWQLAGHTQAELTDQFSRLPEFAQVDQAYFHDLLGLVIGQASELDTLIARHAERSLEQLDAVGRAVLLLALAELKHRIDVPTKVVINEAVELAKRYGPTASFRFVNAVLDRIARELGPRVDASSPRR
jgi:N utilization substance protein B